jgi:hypothetical protein
MDCSCSKVLWFAGVSCFIFGVVFDWINFEGLRRNDIEIEDTGNKACNLALNEYHWIFMVSVICKMLAGFLEYLFGIISIKKGGEGKNTYDTLSLLFSVITSCFQVADLLLLVLFSYKCLDKEKRHHVLRFLGDDTDDAIASIFGTACIIFNLTIKRNILDILKALCEPCPDDNRGCLKILSIFSIILIFVCFGLAIALIIKLF